MESPLEFWCPYKDKKGTQTKFRTFLLCSLTLVLKRLFLPTESQFFIDIFSFVRVNDTFLSKKNLNLYSLILNLNRSLDVPQCKSDDKLHLRSYSLYRLETGIISNHVSQYYLPQAPRVVNAALAHASIQFIVIPRSNGISIKLNIGNVWDAFLKCGHTCSGWSSRDNVQMQTIQHFTNRVNLWKANSCVCAHACQEITMHKPTKTANTCDSNYFVQNDGIVWWSRLSFLAQQYLHSSTKQCRCVIIYDSKKDEHVFAVEFIVWMLSHWLTLRPLCHPFSKIAL